MPLALELGLPCRLLQRGAQRLLFAAQPLRADQLAATGLVELGSGARDTAVRLAADPEAALLARSLRAAARNTAAQRAPPDV